MDCESCWWRSRLESARTLVGNFGLESTGIRVGIKQVTNRSSKGRKIRTNSLPF